MELKFNYSCFFFILDYLAETRFLHLYFYNESMLFALACFSFSLSSVISLYVFSKYLSSGCGFLPYCLSFFSMVFSVIFVILLFMWVAGFIISDTVYKVFGLALLQFSFKNSSGLVLLKLALCLC